MKKLAITPALCALSVSACGGGESAPPPPAPQPPAPASIQLTASGPITGFGSVWINGVKYEVENNTVVAIEDQSETRGDDSRLKLGMFVRVRASETNGVRTAVRIEFDEDLKGPATNVTPDAGDPAIGVFSIAGQSVIVDANTIFDNNVGNNDSNAGIDIRDLDPVNFPGAAPIVVEVSGFPTEDGFLASRIDRVNAAAGAIGKPGVAGDEIEVKGFVDSVAADGSSFTINGATFLVSGTVFDQGLAANQSLVGAFVEVKADIDASGAYIAVRVEREDDLRGADQDDEFEIEGTLQLVDTTSSPNVIVINGVTIETTDASALAGLVGSKVEVKGSFNASGLLVIAQSKVERENTVRLEDRITSVSQAGLSFTTRLGLTVAPTASSRVEYKPTPPIGDQLTPAEFVGLLAANDYVESRGFMNGSSVEWTRVTRENRNQQECRLRGPVDAGSINNPSFSILGVAVNTTGLSDSDFEDESGASIGRAQFFSRLQAGDVIEAKSDDLGTGCRSASLSTGTDGEVSFEDDDDAPAGGGGGAADEIAGTVRNLNAAAGTFEIGGRTITVNPNTLIDDSIVEAARGVELGDNDFRLGDLPETLGQLIADGDVLTVEVTASGDAIRIED